MSVVLTRPANTQPSLRLQLEQMLNPEPSVSEYASSPSESTPSESVADSFDGEDLTHSQYGQGKSGPLGDESDGEADPDWAAQMMDIEIDVPDDQRSEGKSISEIPEDPRALVLRACANLNVRVEFTEECCKDQSSWNTEMQANVENHRTRLADVEKKLTEIETVLGDLMSRVLTAEGKIGNCGEITKKIALKKIGKQSSQKGRTT